MGVSGGADSMALAVLLRGWGTPLAVVVDHGLRRESAAEAGITMQRLAGLGIAARLMTLRELRPGADLGARARAARYEALLGVCREGGWPDLLVAHHAQDQAETVLLRRARGSGAAGLAGMAAIAWRGDARIVRPLLGVMPERLRATLRQAGVAWVEDPSNHDPASARGALRAGGIDVAAELERSAWAGAARCRQEADVARELGRAVSLHPTGHAQVTLQAGAPLSATAWSALLWTVSGRPYPPAPDAVARLAAAGRGTLHGVALRGGIVAREFAATGAPVPAATGAVWDGRFVLRTGVPCGEMGPLGPDASRIRKTRLRRTGALPSLIMRTVPIVRIVTDLLMSAHLDYLGDRTWPSVQVDFRPARPLAGAPFLSA